MRGLAARIKRLEQRARPQRRTHGSVARFTPEGRLVGPMPKAKRIMCVTDFGTDDQWSEQLEAQQARLIESAHIEGMAQ